MLYYIFKIQRWWMGGTSWLEDGLMTESIFIFKKKGKQYRITLHELKEYD